MVIGLNDLRRALERDEMIPHFQPIVELRNGSIVGFEVLSRWNHPVHGPFLPENLIGLSETNGLIGTLTHQVFSKALKAVAQLPGTIGLSVNLSPIQLQYRTLSQQIHDLAQEAGFKLDRLTLEVTESALLNDLAKAQTIAGELKELGCRLSLDDFGTGYSSLAHLQALPFSELKIDRSFVSRMTKKRESRKIVAAMVGLAHSLDISTVAEGIETEAQADILLLLGSELGQGWHFGRPGPFDVLANLVSAAPTLGEKRLVSPGNDWAVSSLEAFPTQRLAQLQAIYDGAPVGLCFLDCKLRYVSLNEKLAQMNGTTVEAHLGQTVKEMMPALYPEVEPYVQRALGGESIATAEIAVPGRMGVADRWILCSYQPAFDEADEVIGISVSILDVTGRKRVEEDLNESEFVQQQLGELNRQVPWMSDAAGNRLQMSSQWVTATPLGATAARNLGWLEALHESDLKRTMLTMKRCLRTGKAIDVQYRVRNPEGEWRWMRSRGLPRFGRDGEITRWYGSVEDVHDKRKADASLRKSKAKVRLLLKSVPVAIMVEDGKRPQLLTIGDAPEQN
jgi:PAS domain S-box-containing protein